MCKCADLPMCKYFHFAIILYYLFLNSIYILLLLQFRNSCHAELVEAFLIPKPEFFDNPSTALRQPFDKLRVTVLRMTVLRVTFHISQDDSSQGDISQFSG
ncbi:hypothetical protein EGI32_16240 [Ferruginibacter sp. HRS2-29]|nr:hypothetical protein [Ferruginibacter sp. HRS2-29]